MRPSDVRLVQRREILVLQLQSHTCPGLADSAAKSSVDRVRMGLMAWMEAGHVRKHSGILCKTLLCA